jgi:hypothetical protein
MDMADSIQGTPLIDLSPQAVSHPLMQRVATNFLIARAAARRASAGHLHPISWFT